MLKDLLNNITKGQLVVIGFLFIITSVLLVPRIPEWYHAATSTDYEPWDPDNINVIKDQIKKLNVESDQINFQLEILPAYEQEIALNRKAFDQAILDSPYVNTLLQIQPYKVISNIETYYDINSDNQFSLNKQISKTFTAQIDSKRALYIQEFNSLANAFGYNTAYNYNQGYTGLVRINDFYPIRQPYYYSDSSKIEKKTILDAGLSRALANEKFARLKANNVPILVALDTLLKERIAVLKKRKGSLTTEQDKLKDDFNKKNFNINQYAVVIGIPFFIIAALLMYWYGLRSNKNLNSTAGELMMDPKDKLSFALNTITVLILILSLLILGLAKVIAENTLAALLGTIGGYVLNNSKNKDAFKDNPSSPSSPSSNTPASGPESPPPPPPPPETPLRDNSGTGARNETIAPPPAPAPVDI